MELTDEQIEQMASEQYPDKADNIALPWLEAALRDSFIKGAKKTRDMYESEQDSAMNYPVGCFNAGFRIDFVPNNYMTRNVGILMLHPDDMPK